MTLDFSTWFPVASISDLPYRHIFQGQLLGREYAIWRADDGNINIWENRCLHRGVRLSIGINGGSELKCQYHGWRYANIKKQTKSDLLIDYDNRLAACGDWLIHGRIESAFEAGFMVAKEIEKLYTS